MVRSKGFSAMADIVPDGISVAFSFDIETEDQAQPGEDLLSSERGLTWRSSACLKPGKPQIVGATQQSQEAVLLILTAHMED
jgi:hypothetical protein